MIVTGISSILLRAAQYVLLHLKVVTAFDVRRVVRIRLLDDHPGRIPKWGADIDEDHAGDLVGVLVRIAGGDVATARGADVDDVWARDPGGLEKRLEVADKI